MNKWNLKNRKYDLNKKLMYRVQKSVCTCTGGWALTLSACEGKGTVLLISVLKSPASKIEPGGGMS